MPIDDASPDPDWRRSKRPRTIVAGTYGFPIHPAVVNVPIGAWFASLVLDVASRTGAPALAIGATWLVGIGVVGALVAAGLGFLDLIQVPAGTYVMRLGIIHMGVNLTATTAFACDFALRLGEPTGSGTPPALIAFSAAAFVALAVGSHLGGSLTYAFGVRVVDERSQRPGYDAIGGDR